MIRKKDIFDYIKGIRGGWVINPRTRVQEKSGIYYRDGEEAYPTTGDFVLINYNPSGDSQIIKTLNRKSFFSRRIKLLNFS